MSKVLYLQASNFGDGCNNPFKCPPKTVAGGRRPRVKSNIKARKRNYWNPRKDRIIKRRKQVIFGILGIS